MSDEPKVFVITTPDGKYKNVFWSMETAFNHYRKTKARLNVRIAKDIKAPETYEFFEPVDAIDVVVFHGQYATPA
jgi:hypothetical protein